MHHIWSLIMDNGAITMCQHVFNALRARRLQSTFIQSDRQGWFRWLTAKLPKKNPERIKEHVNQMQLWLLMNATETLSAEVIRKLAVITRQAERIHLVQPENHRSCSSRLTSNGESEAGLIVTLWLEQLKFGQHTEGWKHLFMLKVETLSWVTANVKHSAFGCPNLSLWQSSEV